MVCYEPTYNDVRQLLAARTTVSSRFGSVLDKLREGRMGAGAAASAYARQVQGHDEVEHLRNASIYRCVDDLYNYASLSRCAWCPDLRKFASRNDLRDGEAVVRVLYAYEPWSSQWPEKGLADVYTWMRSMDRSLGLIRTEDGETEAQSFRLGHSPRARQKASTAVADAHVALHAWVGRWRRRAANSESGVRRVG